VKTPRPAKLGYTTFTVLRSKHGFTSGFGWLALDPLRVSPVSHPPAIGRLRAYTAAQLLSPPGPGIRYAYMLNFAAPPGIIPVLHYTARPADLATVHERYYQDMRSGARLDPDGWATVGGTPAEIAAGMGDGLEDALPVPSRQIQYLSARPSMLWRTFFFKVFIIAQSGPLRLYHAGQHVTGNWNRYPLHPTPNVSLPGAGILPALPSASRAGNTLTLDITPFGDNQRGDVGSGYASCLVESLPCHSRYALYQNGAKIAGGDAVKAAGPGGGLFLRAPLSPSPSLVKLVLTASRASSQYRLSAASKDVWTWRSRPEPGATVPAPWYCSATISHGSPVYHRHCAVQAMTTLRYRVAGLSLSGTTRPGRQRIDITASPLQLARTSPVTHASLQVSFDNGKTWHAASVSKTSAGHFRAVVNAPAAAMVTLRTHATGAGGATVAETILGAYRTTGR
jgi:hypothetical protein